MIKINVALRQQPCASAPSPPRGAFILSVSWRGPLSPADRPEAASLLFNLALMPERNTELECLLAQSTGGSLHLFRNLHYRRSFL